ncbi:unnamed protein product [Rotaria sp. Silwood2]|nr:unnamed protein product [Rotaria sp. Silwood2]
MFKSLPSDILNYRDDNFYQLVKERCGKDMVEFMGILGISSVQSLLGVENLFSWLEFNSEKLHLIKNKLAFQHDNGFTEVKWGVRNSLECLIRDLQRVNDNYQDIKELMSSNENMILSSLLLQKHSTLKSLIHLYQTLDAENNEHKSENVYFLASFLDNISNNLCCSKNAYRHNEHILRFATSFYILSGRMAYEFVRLNVPGALPSISTLQRLVLNKELRINQAEFRYDLLATHMDSLKTAIAFASEDCTPVIKKISYDSLTNSFVGFPTPLNNGIPINQHYQTDSFEQLREWFSNEDRAPLINIHMIQPITKMQAIPNPFLLCAFGTTNQHQSIDIIRRWIWIVEQCLLKNVRIIGFCSDGDPKYLRAMRLLIGLFASLPNIKLSSHTDAFHVKIPKEWKWYFLGDSHLFLCFQDATHLCVKLRNRLLSRTANMLIGKSFISIEYLSTLIQNVSKLRHGLVKSDIFPQDRQNFNSCIKICSDNVINSLVSIPNAEGTIMYLRLLRSVMIAYIDKETSSIDRLFHAWFSVFVCRWWYIWLQNMSKDNLYNTIHELNHITVNQKRITSKKEFYITDNAYYSMEINAHQLTYIALLVIEKKLPLEAMNIYLFSSQTCEGMFRSCRSMSGTFSSVVNFSVQEFLNRAQKLSVLHKIKAESEFCSNDCTLRFPKHHKQGKRLKTSIHTIPDSHSLNIEMIATIVSRAFTDAADLLFSFQIKKNLDEKNITNMDQLNNCIQKVLRTRTNTMDFSELFEETEEIFDSETATDSEDQQFDNEQAETSNVCSNEVLYNLQGATLSGMRVFDTVRPELAKLYFEVELDGKTKFIHKQTACWILTENKAALSNDRLTRMMQK